MKTTRRLIVLSILLITTLSFSGAALSNELGGQYRAQGSNPGGRGNYEGSATITRSGDIFRISWQVGSTYSGTGILTNDVLSVAYTDAKRKWFGVVSYRILDGGNRLQGVWCGHGGKVLGTELLTRP